MQIDLLIIKQDMKDFDVVKKIKTGLQRGRETYVTEQRVVSIALYDKGQTKLIKQGSSQKRLSIIEGFALLDSINIDDLITSFSSLSYRVLETRKINETLLFLKAIHHDVQ